MSSRSKITCNVCHGRKLKCSFATASGSPVAASKTHPRPQPMFKSSSIAKSASGAFLPDLFSSCCLVAQLTVFLCRFRHAKYVRNETQVLGLRVGSQTCQTRCRCCSSGRLAFKLAIHRSQFNNHECTPRTHCLACSHHGDGRHYREMHQRSNRASERCNHSSGTSFGEDAGLGGQFGCFGGWG